jgi:UDP-glucose 4-epimerase
VLVTGGAGYIGGHTIATLLDRGDEVVVVDDMSSGSPARVDGLPLVQADLADATSVTVVAAAMRRYDIDSVIHFAARKEVDDSVERPAWYYSQNVGGLAHLLIAMQDSGVGELVFSSSAAVYGDADGIIDEDAPVRPLNPYGATKLAGEQLVAAAARAWPLSALSLRYFNVGGAGRPDLADVGGRNLIPSVIDAIDRDEAPTIFGDDYETPDGTCVRDYVHVVDVAEAHVAALSGLGGPGHSALNIGTGTGTSVREMISAITHVSGRAVVPRIASRRRGDPAAVVADVRRAKDRIGWESRLELSDIVESAWSSRRQ